MRSSLLIVVSLITLFAMGKATLSVYNLQALGEDDSHLLNISYSIANFGFVPYGKTIIARLMASPNFSSECTVEPGEFSNYGRHNSI